jgi:hypothetical protein
MDQEHEAGTSNNAKAKAKAKAEIFNVNSKRYEIDSISESKEMKSCSSSSLTTACHSLTV